MDSRTETAQSRLEQGTYSAAGEVLDFTFYDSQRIDAAILNHRYFVAGIGQPMSDATIKNISHTNMLTAGMTQGQKFTIRAIKAFYHPAEVRTTAESILLFDLLRASVMTFRIPGKDVLLQLNMLDLLGINFDMTTVDGAAVTNTNPVRSNMAKAYPLNIPIVLSAKTNWEIDLEHTAAPAAGLDADIIMIALQGSLERLA